MPEISPYFYGEALSREWPYALQAHRSPKHAMLLPAMSDRLADFLHRKGDLHDCLAECIEWNGTEKTITLRLSDINANCRGLPEYPGPEPCLMRIEGVDRFRLNGLTAEKNLKIHDVGISAQDGQAFLRVNFWPSGHLECSFTDITFSYLKAPRTAP